MNKNQISVLLIALAIIFGLQSCNQSKDNQSSDNKQSDKKEVTVLCDEAIYNIMEYPAKEYDSVNAHVSVNLVKTTAWDAMAKLLATEAEVILLSRTYSHQEDSLMKAFNVKEHLRMPMAYDALVFYTRFDFPLDTVTDAQLKDLLTNKDSKLIQYYPKVKTEPLFAVNSNLSSEYFNLKKLVTKGKSIARHLKMMPSSDSVKKYILVNPNSIGIGYLSQIIKEPDLKPLSISYIDSLGNYMFPRVVHQANILQKFYPYIVTHYCYLLRENDDPTLSFARFVSKYSTIQKYFNKIGIVPAYAKIKLIDEG